MSAEAQLAELMIDQAGDAIIFADPQGTVQRWNKAAEALFGFSAAEAIGANLDFMIPEHLRAAHWAGFDRAIASGTTRLGGHATVTRAVHKSGRKLYVDMSFALVVAASGAVLGSVAVARDVTARMEAEKARRAAAG